MACQDGNQGLILIGDLCSALGLFPSLFYLTHTLRIFQLFKGFVTAPIEYIAINRIRHLISLGLFVEVRILLSKSYPLNLLLIETEEAP